MAFVKLMTPALSAEAKKRLGDRILFALQQEGIAPGSVVLRYEAERADLYMDGMLVEAEAAAAPAPAPKPQALVVEAGAALENADYKSKGRRTKQELADLKGQLVGLLQRERSLSSFEAQKLMGLEACDWAPATLRRFFGELEEEKLIGKTGQKRGTRYTWAKKGSGEELPPAKLIKGEHHD